MTPNASNRRHFLQSSALAAAGASLGSLAAGGHAKAPASDSAAEQPLLVLREVFPEHYNLARERSRREHEQLARSLRGKGARPVTVGLYQMQNHCGGAAGKEANLARMQRAIRLAAEQNVQVLAFPEMCLPGYFTKAAGTVAEAVRASRELADQPEKSEALARLAAAAREARMVLAFGFVEHDGRAHYNSIGLIDANGDWLGTRRKNPLSPHPYETEPFVEPDPALRAAVFQTRHGKLGVSNCFDGEFPESIRRMRLAGAELLVWCNAGTGNPALGHSSRLNASGCYAQSNRMWVACCNAVGDNCYGTSLVIGPSGEPLVILPPTGEGLAVATIDLAQTENWDTWRLRLDPALR